MVGADQSDRCVRRAMLDRPMVDVTQVGERSGLEQEVEHLRPDIAPRLDPRHGLESLLGRLVERIYQSLHRIEGDGQEVDISIYLEPRRRYARCQSIT